MLLKIILLKKMLRDIKNRIKHVQFNNSLFNGFINENLTKKNESFYIFTSFLYCRFSLLNKNHINVKRLKN